MLKSLLCNGMDKNQCLLRLFLRINDVALWCYTDIITYYVAMTYHNCVRNISYICDLYGNVISSRQNHLLCKTLSFQKTQRLAIVMTISVYQWRSCQIAYIRCRDIYKVMKKELLQKSTNYQQHFKYEPKLRVVFHILPHYLKFLQT